MSQLNTGAFELFRSSFRTNMGIIRLCFHSVMPAIVVKRYLFRLVPSYLPLFVLLLLLGERAVFIITKRNSRGFSLREGGET